MPSGRLLVKLCDLTVIGPTPDRARRYAVDELPTSLDLVESDNDQTLRNRVWIGFKLPVGRILMLVEICGIPGGVKSIVVVTPRDYSTEGRQEPMLDHPVDLRVFAASSQVYLTLERTKFSTSLVPTPIWGLASSFYQPLIRSFYSPTHNFYPKKKKKNPNAQWTSGSVLHFLLSS